MDPFLYIIAGPNGAGKTTFAREFLPLIAIEQRAELRIMKADLYQELVRAYGGQ